MNLNKCRDCNSQLCIDSVRGYNKNATGYCKICVRKYISTRGKPRTVKCAMCQQEVTAFRKNRKYCSARCADRFNGTLYNLPKPAHPLLQPVGKKPKRGEVRQCKVCNIDIYVAPHRIHKKDVFCSSEHMIEYKRNTLRKPVTVNCRNCNTVFISTPSTQKFRPKYYCSINCGRQYRSKLVEERRKSYTKHQLDRLARYSKQASEWRKSVFERDDYTCQMCNKRGGYIEADHIKPWAYFPELRYSRDNGRTLCRACHDTTKMSAKEMKKLYGQQH